MVYKWVNFVQKGIFPAHCQLCGARADHGGDHTRDLCQACLNSLPRLENPCPICALPVSSGADLICGQCLQHAPPYHQTFSAFRYAPPLNQLVTSLKFHQRLAAARLFGQLLTQQRAQHDFDRPECLLPVPLHPKRLRQRGFNQSLEIARPISKHFNLPIDSHLCQRTRHTLPQTGLDAKTRRKNIRNAFSLTTECNYKHVAIIDDVITTGQTVAEIAALLRKNGVEKIQVWSVARAVID